MTTEFVMFTQYLVVTYLMVNTWGQFKANRAWHGYNTNYNQSKFVLWWYVILTAKLYRVCFWYQYGRKKSVGIRFFDLHQILIHGNFRNLSNKSFVQLWNHDKVVLSKNDFIYEFIALENVTEKRNYVVLTVFHAVPSV